MTVTDLHLPAVTPTDTIDWAAIPSPAFVLDETRLRRNLALISHVQRESGAQIIVAFKGFAMWSTFSLLREYGITGATASSLNEAILAKEEMQGEVHVYAPAYSDEDFPRILELADHLVFNSFSQWQRFKPQVEAARAASTCGRKRSHWEKELKTRWSASSRIRGKSSSE